MVDKLWVEDYLKLWKVTLEMQRVKILVSYRYNMSKS